MTGDCGILVNTTRFVKSSSPAKPTKPRRTREPRSGRWRLQDAKARFSELVRRVRSEGPQHVTVHGRDEVVVIAAEEFRRLKGDLTGEALIAAMLLGVGSSTPMSCRSCAVPSQNAKPSPL